jgi:hypothetical protein
MLKKVSAFSRQRAASKKVLPGWLLFLTPDLMLLWSLLKSALVSASS